MTALQEIEEGRCTDALVRFDQMLQRAVTFEQRVGILLNKAKCLELQGQFSEAKQTIKHLRDIDSEGKFRLDEEFQEIMILFTERKPAEAIARAQTVLKDYSDLLQTPEYEDHDYELRFRSSLELVKLERFSDAIKALEEFLPRARESDRSRLHFFLGTAYEFSGRGDDAVAQFKAALATRPDPDIDALSHYHLGALHYKSGALGWAKQHFESAEALKENLNVPSADLYLFLSKVCDRLGEVKQAERYLRMSRAS
jgi:tetratricopeptide (TPR) repeat protein